MIFRSTLKALGDVFRSGSKRERTHASRHFLNIYKVNALSQSQAGVIIFVTSQILLPNKVQCPNGSEHTKNHPA